MKKKCADNRKVSHSCVCVSHCCVPGLLCKYLTLRQFFHSIWLEIKKIVYGDDRIDYFFDKKPTLDMVFPLNSQLWRKKIINWLVFESRSHFQKIIIRLHHSLTSQCLELCGFFYYCLCGLDARESWRREWEWCGWYSG